jgi:hypothetical protein
MKKPSTKKPKKSSANPPEYRLWGAAAGVDARAHVPTTLAYASDSFVEDNGDSDGHLRKAINPLMIVESPALAHEHARSQIAYLREEPEDDDPDHHRVVVLSYELARVEHVTEQTGGGITVAEAFVRAPIGIDDHATRALRAAAAMHSGAVDLAAMAEGKAAERIRREAETAFLEATEGLDRIATECARVGAAHVQQLDDECWQLDLARRGLHDLHHAIRRLAPEAEKREGAFASDVVTRMNVHFANACELVARIEDELVPHRSSAKTKKTKEKPGGNAEPRCIEAAS